MTTKLLTTTLSTGETVLAKSPTEPLRYGNLSSAQRKLDSIQSLLLSSARTGSVIKQDGRFLIFIYSLASMAPSILRRFATAYGKRQNPRNRHNHAHKDQTDKPYYFGG